MGDPTPASSPAGALPVCHGPHGRLLRTHGCRSVACSRNFKEVNQFMTNLMTNRNKTEVLDLNTFYQSLVNRLPVITGFHEFFTGLYCLNTWTGKNGELT